MEKMLSRPRAGASWPITEVYRDQASLGQRPPAETPQNELSSRHVQKKTESALLQTNVVLQHWRERRERERDKERVEEE